MIELNLNTVRRFFLLSLFLVGYSQLFAEPIKTMSWNIEWFPGNRPKAKQPEQDKQINAASLLLTKEAPQILLAQEISSKEPFERLIATIPGLKTHIVSNFREVDGSASPQQCAIASKLEADSAWFESFKPSEQFPNLRRGFAFAALKHPNGGLIMAYCVHLKSNRGGDSPEGEKSNADTRAESIKQLLTHKTEMEKKFSDRKILGWIIGGDYNTNHDGQFKFCTVISDLQKAGFHNTWENTPKEKRQTWRPKPFLEDFSPTTFDYIMTLGFKKSEAIIVTDVPTETSDHAPLFINLEIE